MSSSVQDRNESDIDLDALRDAVRRARQLYTAEARSEDVARVTEELRHHLHVVIPVYREIVQRIPEHSLTHRRFASSLAIAEQLLNKGAAQGALSSVVHMQLLADSLLALAARTPEQQP